MDDRPTVDQYFMDMTHLVKSRGTCPRRQVGAVIVKDKRVLTTGYNGAPRNFPHPTDTGCIRDELGIPSGMMADVCPCLHAEQNAILQAATTGVSIEGGDIYCTTQPCTQCSRMIANCGLKRVVFEHEYADPLSIGLLVTAGVELWKWDGEQRTAHRYGQSNTFEQAQEALRRKWKEGAFTATGPRHEVQAGLREALHISEHEPSASAAAARRGRAGAPGDRSLQKATSGGDRQTTTGGDRQEARPTGGSRQETTAAGAREDAANADRGHDEEVPAAAGEARVGEPQARGIRDLAGDPEREQKIREMLANRKERLQRALGDRKD